MPKKETKNPDSVVLAAPYGYVDDAGGNHHWHAGHVINDPEQIADLIERRAPLVDIVYE